MRFCLFILLLTSNCFANSEFFSKRDNLISVKPIVATKNAEASSVNDIAYEQKDSFDQSNTKKEITKKNILGNPLGLAARRLEIKKEALAKKAKMNEEEEKKEAQRQSPKNEIEKKLDKLNSLDQAILAAKSIGQGLSENFPSSKEISKIIDHSKNKEAIDAKSKTKGYKF